MGAADEGLGFLEWMGAISIGSQALMSSAYVDIFQRGNLRDRYM